ncbi:Ger(x)C family spore germination C-terminal domain-containing protein [Paenibacillus hexagrammi]|uniref:Ger(X)C family spore germination C-terminal domain-containing protein n=1 Tax=Paenibacillus hexagrammi TaxID=2908839 RepID=A0ABY3SGP5_9BACL|nr:Ger(x)C family spore germination C-terminal domain-containing protein [Paenibacillus sp. YPD9-1]UJF32364.1 Ger(x)C family spore germination C-terminal domain-containing protein [Paenibacillus sp. YPD9-1]
MENDESYMLSADDVNGSFRVLDGKSEIPLIKVNVKVTGLVEESTIPLQVERIDAYQQMAEKEIEDRVLALVKKFQKNKVDPMGFGRRYRAMHPGKDNHWEEWLQAYPKAEFEVKAKVRLRGTGTIR